MAETDSEANEWSLIGLVQEFRRGVEGAQNEICERLRPLLLRLCYGRIFRALRAKFSEEDIVQVVSFNVSEKLVLFRGATNEELRAWVSQIANCTMLEFQRHYLASKRDVRRECNLEDQNLAVVNLRPKSESQDPLDQLISIEFASRINFEIDQLPAIPQRIVRMRLHEHLSFPRIAELLGGTEAQVKSLYQRTVKYLRQRLHET